MFGAPQVHVLIGDDAHTSVFSALQFRGLGHGRVVRVATDANGRIVPAAFTRAMAGANGPAIVIIQAGQINTGAFDPIAAILPDRGHAEPGCMWMARLGCGRAPAPQPRTQLADSWAIDGHRWLQTPCDCGYAIVRDAEAHRRAMTISASYLPPAAAGDRDPTHFVPELSRRARGFATWAMIRHLGRAGIAALVQEHCRLAARVRPRLMRESGVYVLNDVVLNQVAVRFGTPEADETADRLTPETILRIQDDGACFAGGARWRDPWVMRLSVISAPTIAADIDRSFEAICTAWRSVARSNLAGRPRFKICIATHVATRRSHRRPKFIEQWDELLTELLANAPLKHGMTKKRRENSRRGG